MSLKSMHEASRQPREQESNLQLIEEQSQMISEQEQTISNLSFQVSMLKSEMQKIADRNVKLNEADIVLKNNEELMKQNEFLKREKQRVETEARVEIGNIKREYTHKEELLSNERTEVQRRIKEAETLKKNMKTDIQEQAEEIAKSVVESVKTKYKVKISSHYAYVTMVSLYAILVTVFTAIRLETPVIDFKSFFSKIWVFILSSVNLLVKGANFVSQLGDKIPQPIVAIIVHWLLWLVVVGGIGICIVILLFIGLSKLVKFYTKHYADNISFGVVLVSLSISVFFGAEIRKVVPINLLLLLIITHVLYMGVRWYIEKYVKN